MYVLDTNVVSELRKANQGKANKNVVAWSNSISPAELYISAITILEHEMGILTKESKDPIQGIVLRDWMNNQVLPTFADRTISVDTSVAQCCAKLHVPDPKSDRDALIAATALTNGMVVVTRNIADFKLTKVKLINPWDYYNPR